MDKGNYSMNNDESAATIEKLLAMPYEKQWDETGTYPLASLEVLAIEAFKKHNSRRRNNDLTDLLNMLLGHRALMLNKSFIWSHEQSQKLIKISDAFMNNFDRAYSEALRISFDMEKRIQDANDFVQDYDIEIQLTPYKNEENDDIEISTIHGILSELVSDSILTYSITHRCYDEEQKELPVYLDKSVNWNIQYFGNTFDNDYIGYAIHELLDTDKWSIPDILQIDTIHTALKVYQHRFDEKI
jgi:hypothetical protein